MIDNTLYNEKYADLQDLQEVQVAACREFYTPERNASSRRLSGLHVSVVHTLSAEPVVSRVAWSSEVEAWAKAMQMFGGISVRRVIVNGREHFEY